MTSTFESNPDDDVLAVVDPDEVVDPPQRWRVLRRFARNKAAMLGLAILVGLVVMAIFAPWLAPKDPNKQNLLDQLRRPGDGSLLGTDEYGRDVLSRIIYGSRVSVQAVLVSVGLGASVGIPMGMLAGVRPGWIDAVFSRFTDAFLAVPGLLFLLTFVTVMGKGLNNALIAIGIITIPTFFRIARASTQDVRGETYVEASRALGCRQSRIMFRHILPNAMGPLLVRVALGAGAVITAEASLSFLGFGVIPPTASWGSMLAAGRSNMMFAPYLVYAPGAMIALMTIACMLVGDGLRRAIGTTRDAVGQ